MRRSNFGLQKPSPKSAHRKVQVSSNVRPHKYNVCASRRTVKSQIPKKAPYPRQSANLMQGSMEYLRNDGMETLARSIQCRFRSSLGKKVSSSSPPPFGAISLRGVHAAAAGKSTRAAPEGFARFGSHFMACSACIVSAKLFIKTVMPNRSLNRTLCGGPILGPKV